jgi:hypothetical protein
VNRVLREEVEQLREKCNEFEMSLEARISVAVSKAVLEKIKLP